MGKKIFAVLSVLTLSLCVFACVDTKTGLGGLGEITITGPASSGAASGSEGENSGGEGENPGSEGENPGGEGENPGGEGENPGGEGENPPPEPEIPLPEKVYIQVRFDLHDDGGGLYSESRGSGVTGIEFQYEEFQLSTGYLIKGVYHDTPAGYVWPYGFIAKYGGSKELFGPDNQKIARYNAGIDYYVGHENLYVIPQTSGTTSVSVYLVFYFKPSILYDRSKQQFVIPWDSYDPSVHTDKALFYISVVNRSWSVTFDGFEEKNPSDLP